MDWINLSVQDDLFHNVTVDELLFRGYSPGVLKQFTMIISLLTQIIPASMLPPMPDMLLEGKFGLWYGKNNSMKDAYWTINTGDRHMNEYAQVMKYNGEEELPGAGGLGWVHHLVPTGGVTGECVMVRRIICLQLMMLLNLLQRFMALMASSSIP